MCGGENKKYRRVGNECRLSCSPFIIWFVCLWSPVKMVYFLFMFWSSRQCSECRSTIGYNGSGLCVRAGFGAQNFQPALNLNKSTKPQVCTSARLTQNPCYMPLFLSIVPFYQFFFVNSPFGVAFGVASRYVVVPKASRLFNLVLAAYELNFDACQRDTKS